MEQYENHDPTILMQVELLKRHPDWIGEHAADFREKFLPDHPEVIEEFKADPDETIKKIEGEFYH